MATSNYSRCVIRSARTTVPENACIGPSSSSWKLSDADESNRDLAANEIPEAHWALRLFLGAPIRIFATFFGVVPWLGALTPIATHGRMPGADKLHESTNWFLSPTQIACHYATLAARTLLAPAFCFLAVYVFKKKKFPTCSAVL